MLSKLFRFHGYGGVRAIQRQGKSVRGQYLSLKYLKERPPHRPFRAAVVVSRKVSKSSPVRNRIRRRVYEIVRQQPISGGADLVISCYDARLETMSHPELQSSIIAMLKKAGLLSS